MRKSRLISVTLACSMVTYNHHRRLVSALDVTMVGAAWQPVVHSMRNVLAKVPKGRSDMVAAGTRRIFAPPNGKLVREQVAAPRGDDRTSTAAPHPVHPFLGGTT